MSSRAHAESREILERGGAVLTSGSDLTPRIDAAAIPTDAGEVAWLRRTQSDWAELDEGDLAPIVSATGAAAHFRADCGHPAVARRLGQLGFERRDAEVLVQRSLLDPLPPVLSDDLAWAELGPDEAIDPTFLDRITSAPDWAKGRSAGEDLASHLEGHRASPDAAAWVGRLRGHWAALFVTTAVESDGCAGLALVAVDPEYRGRGFGGQAHARALHVLAQRGARTYVDATDLENRGMRNLFTRHGCRPAGVLLRFTPQPADATAA